MKDPEIRRILNSTVLKDFNCDPQTKVVEELRLSPSPAQIDIAVINGSLHGYEIKSASDNLSRLKNQIESYSKVFDYVSVVTEPNHLKKVLQSTPNWVGVSMCTNDHIIVKRKPQRNKEINGFYLAQLLWKTELLDLLNISQIAHKKSERNWILCEKINQCLESETISNKVRSYLKRRIEWKEPLAKA